MLARFASGVSVAEPKLLPCPHCGGLPEWNVGTEGEHWIDCPRCNASTGLRYSLMADCRPALAEQWNNRQDGCAALKALIAHWDEFGPEHGFDELVDSARRAVAVASAGGPR